MAGWLRFQRSLLQRVSTYADEVRKLASSGSIDPGDWIGDYASFWSGVIGDFGDSLIEPDVRASTDERLPIHRAKLRTKEGATSCAFKVSADAFGDAQAPDGAISLKMDGLVPRGGGTILDRGHFEFRTTSDDGRVDPVDRRAVLHVFGVRGVVQPKTIYSGLVWVAETHRPIAVVEITVE